MGQTIFEILVIVFTFLRIYAFMCLWNLVYFWKHLSQYHKVYETLNSRKWYIIEEKKVILSSPLFTKEMIVWLYERDSFNLTYDVLLFKSNVHYLTSPYSVYWLWKYKKWFKKNIDLSAIENLKLYDESN